ncbi:sugar ABC transporter permease [Arthrobacter sp. H5]|uniref:carbohydrate ABC transporter permease n=1 Tax=Arthrobacter sp. H5 TaxID=1267973 RepID=UPI0004825B63|nr:sugar ABC transporter permease [Arthrobacter sp. H5]
MALSQINRTSSRGRTAFPSGPGGGLRRGRSKNDGVAPWLFILPTFLGIGIFFLWPMAQSVYFSFTEWGAFGGNTWTGLENYRRLVSDADVLGALMNTVVYAGVSLLSIPVAIYLAGLINRPGLRFKGLFRTLYFLPVITMPAAVSIVWRIMYNGDFGIINYLLSTVGIQGPYWLATPGVAIIAVALVGIWTSLGMNMIILGAGLQGIPTEIYEAAELDGASPWRQFRAITVPLLTPSIFFVTVMTVIGSFKVFDLLFVMLGAGNPVTQASQTLVYLFYDKAFIANDKGYAAAIGLLLLVLIALVTFLQFRLQKKWVTYA